MDCFAEPVIGRAFARPVGRFRRRASQKQNYRHPVALRGAANSLATVTRRIRRRGERAISRKAIAQGMPECSGCTCMLVCVFYVQFAHEIAGAACTRCSLRPLFSRAISCITRAHRAARRCGVMSVMPSYSKIMLALGCFEIVLVRS